MRRAIKTNGLRIGRAENQPPRGRIDPNARRLTSFRGAGRRRRDASRRA